MAIHLVSEQEFTEAGTVRECIKYAYVQKEFTFNFNGDLVVFSEDGDYVISHTDRIEVNVSRYARSGISSSEAFVNDVKVAADTLAEVWPYHKPNPDLVSDNFDRVIDTIWNYVRLRRTVEQRDFTVTRKFDKFVGTDEIVKYEDIYIKFESITQLDIGNLYDLTVHDDEGNKSTISIKSGAIYELGLRAVKDRFDLEHGK